MDILPRVASTLLALRLVSWYSSNMEDTQEKTYIDNKVVIMNGFTHEEIHRIMRAVKKEFEKPRDLIFAMTTENSLEMKLKDLIEDMSEDHEYLKKNPPRINQEPNQV